MRQVLITESYGLKKKPQTREGDYPWSFAVETPGRPASPFLDSGFEYAGDFCSWILEDGFEEAV